MRRRRICNLLFGLILCAFWGMGNPKTANAATIHHYEYVFTPGFISVYDMDNGFTLLKTVQVPTSSGMRGGVASVATGMLYLAYGSDGNTGGFQLAYDLSTDKIVWTMSYSHGIDSQSISPDGKKIYMPQGELASGGTWYVEDTVNGNDLATISTPGSGPHNTIVSPNGNRVYMGDRDFTNSAGTNDFSIADTTTNQIVAKISPLRSGARPFTINSAETLSFNTVTGFIGFQVGDIAAGKVIYTVAVDGSKIPGFTTQSSATAPSHGISLSPDNKEIYVMDSPNSYVHVFDVTGLPGSAPVQVADIKLVNVMSGTEVGCPYDCVRSGWLHHSRDGRFVFVGDAGDVIDTLTRKTIATLPQMSKSRQQIEIDFQDNTPIWAATSRSGVGYVNPLPPTFTARITSPALGSTVSGSNVTVSTSVFDSASISAVDLYKDGVLFASTTSSPYTFTWDTTKDANGTHRLTITASDTVGNATSFLGTFTVNNVSTTPNPPSITTSSLPAGTQNAAYSATLAATGGTTPYTWSVTSGTLPAGLALASSTGVISGTPTGTGTSNFSIKVTDTNSQAATKALSLTINASGVSGGGAIGLVQANAIQGSGVGSVSVTFPASNTAGNLIIAFVRMSTSTQTVTLADSAGNTYIEAVAQLQTVDGSQSHLFYAKNILGAPNTVKATFSSNNNHPWLAVFEYRGLNTSNPLDQTAHALGTSTTPNSGPTPITTSATELVFSGLQLAFNYTGTETAGSGYTLVESDRASSPASTESMVVTTTGSYSATYTLSSSANWSALVATFVGSAVSMTTTTLPNATQNGSYSSTLAAAGGTPPYTWSITSGTLPAGLSLDPSSGVISGTPTSTGTSSFIAQVTDTNSLTDTKSLSLTVVAPPTVTTASLPGGTQNAAYSATLAATGGIPPYTWSITSGALPTGLSLSSSTGAISGTPTAAGTSSFTVQVSDVHAASATQALSLIVAAPSSPSITTSSLPAGTQNATYSATLAATGGTTPYTWSVTSGTLPAGLALAPSTGVISGTPTAAGTTNFTVKVTDANSQAATKVLNLTINASGVSGGGAIGLVQANAIQGSGVGSVSVTFPASNTAGNLIIAFVRMSTTSQTVTVTDSLGNSYVDAVTQGQTSDGHQVHIFYAKNILAGANTVKATFSASNNHPWLAIYEYRGLSVTSPLDQTGHAQGNSTTPNSGATAATLNANELVFAGIGLPSSYSGTATAGSGCTMLQQDINTSPADNDSLVATSTGTYAATFTLSSNTNWSAIVATFKP